jgi:tetratricopeptide (TPR) repeat protein
LEESNENKLKANKLFGSSEYPQAIGSYEAALESCPNYLDFEIAILRSNIAACHLKLQDWKAAILAATAAIETLDQCSKNDEAQEDNRVEELADEAPTQTTITTESKHSKEDKQRIRAKALMRRAKARTESGGWSALQGAEEGEFLVRCSTHADLRRLQAPLLYAWSSFCRHEDCPYSIVSTTSSYRRGKSKGNGGDDGQAEASKPGIYHLISEQSDEG